MENKDKIHEYEGDKYSTLEECEKKQSDFLKELKKEISFWKQQAQNNFNGVENIGKDYNEFKKQLSQKDKEIEMLQIQIADCNDGLLEYEKQLSDFDNKIRLAENKIIELEAEKNATNEAYNKLLNEKLQTKKLYEEEMNKEIEMLQIQVADCNDGLLKYEKQLSDFDNFVKEEIDFLDNEIYHLTNQPEEIRITIHNMSKRKNKLSKKYGVENA